MKRRKKVVPVRNSLDAIKRRLTRLQTLYLEEMIDLDAYREEYRKLSGMLAESKAEESVAAPSVEKVAGILKTDFEEMYVIFSAREKNALWGSFVKHIYAYDINRFEVVFL